MPISYYEFFLPPCSSCNVLLVPCASPFCSFALRAFEILRLGQSQVRPLLYLIVCRAVTTGSVGWIKHATIKSCPWDLQRYGGVSAYVELGDAAVRASGVRPDHCFPGAHSSSAFAFFGLYFLALRYRRAAARRSEEHTSELQSLMRISYAVFCLKKKQHRITYSIHHLSKIITIFQH